MALDDAITETILNQAFSLYEKPFAKMQADVETNLNQLAALYSNQGHVNEAEPIANEVLLHQRIQLESFHPAIVAHLYSLATFYRNQERFEEAELVLHQVLAVQRKQLGDNHPDIANTLNQFALLYHRFCCKEN